MYIVDRNVWKSGQAYRGVFSYLDAGGCQWHLSLVPVDTMKAPTTVRIVKTFPDSFSPLFVFTGVTHDAES